MFRCVVVEAIAECLEEKFHVSSDMIFQDFGSNEFYHEEMTFIRPYESSKGTFEVFQYINNRAYFQTVRMDVYKYSFRVDYLLQEAQKFDKRPPILNFMAIDIKSIGNKFFKGVIALEQIVMDKEEYRLASVFGGEIHYSECQTFRFRTIFVDSVRKAVFLRDSKAHPIPNL